MAFALVVAAGLAAGLLFDLFGFCAISAPFFVFAFAVGLKAGLTGALAKAAAMSALLQGAYVLGLLARVVAAAPTKSARPGAKRDGH